MELILDPSSPPLNKWNKSYISPGLVGSVGDVLISTKLKQSAPDMEPRYEYWNTGLNTIFYGSNVQDGYSESFTSNGMGSKTVSRPIYRYTGYKTNVGWRHQDIVPTDNYREAKQAALPQFGWKSQVASILRTKHTGEMFTPLPGGYGPSSQTRGTQHPTVVSRSATGSDVVESVVVSPATGPAYSEEQDVKRVVRR